MPLGQWLITHFREILTLLLWETEKTVKILIIFFLIKIFFKWIVNHYLKGLFDWRSGKVGGWKISRRIEKIWFSPMCVWLEWWKSGRVRRKIFYLVGEKKRRMKNVVYINWLLCPCYIIIRRECNKVRVFV